MRETIGEYRGHDGISMLLRTWTPDDRPKAVVIGIHGLGSHSGLLESVGKRFASEGFSFVAPDMRGFGNYSGLKGHVESFNEYVWDIDLLVSDAKRDYPESKIFLFGHSLGGLHVIRYAAKHAERLNGIMIPAPAVAERLKLNPLIQGVLKLLAAVGSKKLFNNGLDLELIAKNPEVIQKNKEDPLRFDQATPRFAVKAFRAMHDAFNSAPRLTLPVILQQPGQDKILDPEKIHEFFELISSDDKTWKMYPEMYHEPFEDPEAEEFFADLFQWLNERA